MVSGKASGIRVQASCQSLLCAQHEAGAQAGHGDHPPRRWESQPGHEDHPPRRRESQAGHGDHPPWRWQNDERARHTHTHTHTHTPSPRETPSKERQGSRPVLSPELSQAGNESSGEGGVIRAGQEAWACSKEASPTCRAGHTPSRSPQAPPADPSTHLVPTFKAQRARGGGTTACPGVCKDHQGLPGRCQKRARREGPGELSPGEIPGRR